MARADLLLNLVKSGAHGDLTRFQKTVEALAAEERAKNHHVLAERLIAQMNNSNRPKMVMPANNRHDPSHYLAEIFPRQRLDDLILSKPVQQTVNTLIQEQHRADLLRAHNLEPRHRLLLAGPPGNGKTSLAEALAESLSVPLLLVRYEGVIGSYLGETAQKLAQVFDYARSRHCVLFFDEFDVVGKERGDTHETGEIKRVVSSLLLKIDSLPSHVVVATASNHPELLDRAVWRRFQIRLHLPMPRQGQIEEWFRKFQQRTGHVFDLTPRSFAQRLKGLSFSEIEEFGLDVLRRLVLCEPGRESKTIIEQCFHELKNRYSPEHEQP